MNQFKRLYNFYFRVSAIIFGKQSKTGRMPVCRDKRDALSPFFGALQLLDSDIGEIDRAAVVLQTHGGRRFDARELGICSIWWWGNQDHGLSVPLICNL